MLIPARRSGLRLVTASPHASGTAELTADDVLLDVDGLADGAEVQAVAAVGLDGSASLEAERTPDGRHRVTVPVEGSWKVRAQVDGTWRDVAWRGPGPVPSGDGTVHVELSPRGYIVLRREG